MRYWSTTSYVVPFLVRVGNTVSVLTVLRIRVRNAGKNGNVSECGFESCNRASSENLLHIAPVSLNYRVHAVIVFDF